MACIKVRINNGWMDGWMDGLQQSSSSNSRGSPRARGVPGQGVTQGRGLPRVGGCPATPTQVNTSVYGLPFDRVYKKMHIK